MFAALTGMGLSAAAGLNAYIPYLLVALLARFTDVVNLPASFSWVESNWSIAIGTILLITEFVVDKIPALDTVNDALGTVIRPASGAVVFAATAAAANLDNSQWMTDHPWVGLVGGAIVAGIFHTGKAAARPVVNLGTGGLGAPVMSTAEDIASISMSLAAVFAPILALVIMIAVLWLAWRLWSKVKAFRERRAQRSAGYAA